MKSGVDPLRIEVSGFPVLEEFTRPTTAMERDAVGQELGLSTARKVLLLNSGAQGSLHYLKILHAAAEFLNDYQIVLLCGRNRTLLKKATSFASQAASGVIRVVPFVENVARVLRVADVVITKPGANSFFECLHMKTPMILDGVAGLLYQEKGVIDYLREFPVGRVMTSLEQLPGFLREYADSSLLSWSKSTIEAMGLKNGSGVIAGRILESLTAGCPS